jgi:hypothetical protein
MEEFKQSFTHSEIQDLIRQINAIQINGERVFKARDDNWDRDGLYLTIETMSNVGHFFLPLTKKEE